MCAEELACNFNSSGQTSTRWRETKILLIDDNAARRHELAIILSFLGEEHLACTSQDWRSAVAGLESSREVLSVLLGDVEAKGARA